MALKCGNTGCKNYDKNGYGTHDCRRWITNLPHKCGFVEATAPQPVSPSISQATGYAFSFGQVVEVTEKYRRRVKSRNWKYWDRTPFATGNCIFLGIRILQNGTRSFDHDEGWSFDCHERFKAALVCPGPKMNPVFVPLDAIKA